MSRPSRVWLYPLVLAVMAIVIMITTPGAEGWGDPPTVADLIVAVLALASLVVFEVREARDHILDRLGVE